MSRVRAVLNKKGVLRVEAVQALASGGSFDEQMDVGLDEWPTVFIGDEENA